MPEVYVSTDVETDGPVPAPFSMLSFGMSVVGTYDGDRLHREEPGPATTFYRELKPISDSFDEETLAVTGFDRTQLRESGAEPRDAMSDAAEWARLANLPRTSRPQSCVSGSTMPTCRRRLSARWARKP